MAGVVPVVASEPDRAVGEVSLVAPEADGVLGCSSSLSERLTSIPAFIRGIIESNALLGLRVPGQRITVAFGRFSDSAIVQVQSGESSSTTMASMGGTRAQQFVIVAAWLSSPSLKAARTIEITTTGGKYSHNVDASW